MRTFPLAAWLLFYSCCPLYALDYTPLGTGSIEDAEQTIWAKPLEGGTIACAVVAPRFALYDAQALAVQFDTRIQTVPLWEADHLGYDPALAEARLDGYSAAEVAERLSEAIGDRPDVVVLARFPFSLLPEAAGQALVNSIQAGRGLLLVEFADGQDRYPPWLEAMVEGAEETEDAPLLQDGAPADSGLQVKTLRVGKGRLCILQYSAASPLRHCLVPAPPEGLHSGEIRYDNALAVVGRALRWSAGRDTAVRIAAVRNAAPRGPDPDEIPPFLTPEFMEVLRNSMTRTALWPFLIELNAPAEQSYEVSVRVRNPAAERQLPAIVEERPWPRGAAAFPVSLRVGPGNYFIDVWLRHRGRVVAWHTTPVTLRGWPELTAVRPDVTYLESGASLRLDVELPPTHATFSMGRTGTLYARALDAQGIEITRNAVPIGAATTTAALRLEFSELQTPLVKVETYAIDGDVGQNAAEWTLHRAHRRDLHFPVLGAQPQKPFQLVAVAPSLDEYNTRAYLRVLAEHGFDAVHAPGDKVTLYHAARLGLGFMPELIRFEAPETGGVVRQPCFTNETFLDNTETLIRQQALDHLAGASGTYSLGFGNALCRAGEPSCQSPTCVAAFQRYLEGRYRRISTLNEHWGTDFPAWEAVEGAWDTVAGRMDFEASMEAVFTTLHAKARATLKGIDPNGRAGFAVSRDGRGFDWYGLAGALDYVAVPSDASALLAKARDYQAKPGAWMGVAPANSPAEAWHAWRAALYQLGGLWCPFPFGSADDAAPAALLSPAGELTAAAAALCDANKILGSGVGALLLAAERTPASIAIYESRSSRHLEAATPAPRPDSAGAEDAFVRIFASLGFEPTFVAQGQLTAAKLADCKVLVLPALRVLSAEERETIVAFAERGGALVAGLPPGTHDAQGRPTEDATLLTYFGATRDGAEALALRYGPGGSEIVVDGSVRASESKAVLEGAPIGMLRLPAEAEGPGPGLLLNWCPTKADAAGGLAVEWLGAFLRALDIAPPVAGDDAFPMPDSERFQLTYGDAVLRALLAGPDAEAAELAFDLPKGHAAYDLIAGMPLKDRRGRVRAQAASGQALITATLPYEVESVEAAPVTAILPGTPATVLININTKREVPAGTHLVAVHLLDMTGEAMMDPVFAECPNGIGSAVFTVHYDGRRGPATIRVVDLLTGTASEVALVETPHSARIGP